MILPLAACMFLCLCLAYAFVSCKSEFDFCECSALKGYVQATRHLSGFCFWLLSSMQCTMYMYGCGHTFSTFHFHFFGFKIFLSFCVGALHLKIWSKVGGNSLSVIKKRTY